MLNLKAPKDMTAPELVAEIKKRYSSGEYCGLSTINMTQLSEMMREHAPNPFTPDQLAWMREEQRNGYMYSAKNKMGSVMVYCEKPYRDHDRWLNTDKYQNFVAPRFLNECLSWDDPEPLCFADYAPLEGSADV